MRRHFEKQLEELNTELIAMGALCKQSIALATRILLKDERGLKQEVESMEESIDRKEREIETLCLRLLLQQQPVAGDLRIISAALKMISDMERIGDQSRDIAEISVEMNECLSGCEGSTLPHIGDMATATSDMVTRSIDSFVRRDLALARAVMAEDSVVDELFEKIKQELSSLIRAGSGQGEFCIDLLMIAKYLERIGDHAVNIAEWVEFSLTGRHAVEEQR
ncbi:MAG: phosphate signaling complex protein PhoU [Desulfovibrionaceae bacterium]|nr:phosphate signaling complex protein PhoU [Desulfovibrionaceae bacterium]